ncbi:2757_t:CDS:2, partial [Ambispora leptoticha]
HNQQAEAALAQLQKVDQSREEAVKALQEAKNKSEKQIAFQLEQENFSVENKIFLQTVLGKLIPETLKNDNDEAELTALENQLKTFQTASESEEKGEIYQKYKKTIDQILTEIRQEKQRYQQTKLPDSQEEQIPKGDKQKPSSGGRLPD